MKRLCYFLLFVRLHYLCYISQLLSNGKYQPPLGNSLGNSYVVSYIFYLIFLNLSLQHTNTILHNKSIIKSSQCPFSFNKYIREKGYRYGKRKK